MYRKWSFIVLIILFCTIASGCWGKRELNEIGIVTVTGIDSEPDGRIRITVISIQPTGNPSVTQTQQPDAWIGTGVGDSVLEASRDLSRISSRSLVWFQNRLIIIGEEMAKKGLNVVLDFYARQREIRYNSHVLVAVGKAYDLLQLPSDIEGNLQGHLEGLIRTVQEWPGTYVPHLKDILISLSEKHTDTLVGRIGYFNTTRSIYSTNVPDYYRQYWKGTPIGVPLIDGIAVFNNDRLAGWLDSMETRGCNWILSRVKSAVLTVGGENSGGRITVEINQAKSRIIPICNERQITMKINLTLKADFMEQTDHYEVAKLATARMVQRLVSQAVKAEMEQAVKKARVYGTDIFGFGGYVYRRYPEVWKRIGSRWDDFFTHLDVQYDVRVVLVRFGETYETDFPDNTSGLPGMSNE